MSDEIHVHRAADWFESPFQPIERAEWEAYVNAHTDLVPWPDGTIRWTDHPAGTSVPLVWDDGRIVADNLDVPTRIRLARIAVAFQGVLQGDDCEVYGADGEPLVEDDPALTEQAESDARDADLDRIWDPDRPTSRGDFLRGLLRRE